MLYTIIDIESNGLNKDTAEVLEFGYIQINKDCEIIRSGTLFFWKDGWSVGRGDIHHLSSSYLSQYADDFDENLVKMFTIMYNSIVIGKNSDSFDIPCVLSFLARHAGCLANRKIYGVLDMQTYMAPKFQEWQREVKKIANNRKGTLEEYMEMMGKSQAEILREFEELFPDCPRKQAHCALYDVYMTYLTVKYAVEKYGLQI